MPTVPFQERQVISRTPEIQGVSPVASGAAYGEVERAGYRMQQLGDAMTDFAAAQKRAEQVLELSTAKIDLDTAIDGHLASYEGNPNHKEYLPTYDEFAKTIPDTFQKRVSPEVYRVLEPTVRNKIQNNRIKLSHVARKMAIVEGRGQVERNKEAVLKKLAVTDDPIDAGLLRSQLEMDLGAAAEVGYITTAERDETLSKVPRLLQTYKLDVMLERMTDPGESLMVRNLVLDPKNFTDLDPTDRVKYAHAFRSRASELIQEFNRQERDVREATDLQAYEMVKDTSIPASKKKAQLEAWTQADPITGIRPMTRQVKEHYENIIDNPKGAKDAKSDPFAWGEAYDKAINQDPEARGYILRARAQGKLSESDYEGLTKLAVKEVADAKKEAKKEADAATKELNQIKKVTLMGVKDRLVKMAGSGSTAKQAVPLMMQRIQLQADLIKSADQLPTLDKYVQDLLDYQQREGWGDTLKGIAAQISKEALEGSIPRPAAKTATAKAPASSGNVTKTLTADIVQGFMKEAGGDRAKAKELARKAGYSF